MEFRVLGPLQVLDGDREIDIPAGRLRALLATLLLRANQIVAVEDLIVWIWGDDQPGDARATAQTYVRRLRCALGEGLISTRAGGYQLSASEDQLDLARFDALLEQARVAVDPEHEAALLKEGLALWRGPVLINVPSDRLHRDEVPALNERRLRALERRIALDLDAGRHADLVGELHALTAKNPLRERFWAQLIRALAGSGRAAEAVQAYDDVRGLLGTELGLDPGPELQELHGAVLRGEEMRPVSTPSIASTGRSWVPPAQLPPDVSCFTGRAGQLNELDTSLPANGGPGPLWTIEGAAGVGKTALAVHWAHRVRDSFSDGQLYVDLRGHAAGEPAHPLAVLTSFLRAMGVPSEQVPAATDEAASLYRSLLADKRVLVVLDNASDPSQVRPLLPGGRGCAVLVTSRQTLTGLVARDGARRLALDMLDADDAHSLLTQLIGADRAKAAPEAVAQLVELCGRLPLALRIAAANMTAHRQVSLADYTAQLRDTDRLAALVVEGDDESAVQAAFALSYQRLPAAAQRMFRLLGSMPGPHIGVRAAAALVDSSVDDAAKVLDSLAGGHLLVRLGDERYGFHDLLRLYAVDRAHAQEPGASRAAAAKRLDDHYLMTANAAACVLYPEVLRLPQQPSPKEGISFGDHADALGWLDAERSTLVALIQKSAADGSGRVAWLLADALRGYFYMRMHTVDWETAADAALAAADAAGDLHGIAAARLSFANLCWRRGQHDSALDHARSALESAVSAGWVEGTANIHGNLGAIYSESGRVENAAEQLRAALALYEESGASSGIGVTLGNLGIVLLQLGRLDDAAAHVRRAEVMNRTLGSPNGKASNLAVLSEVHLARGRYDEAAGCADRALSLYRSIGNRGGTAIMLCTMARIHRDAGRYDEALERADEALTLADGDHRVGGDAHSALAGVQHALGHHHAAVESYRRAVELTSQPGDRYIQVEALVGLGSAYLRSGQHEHARCAAQQALAVSRQAGFRVFEGHGLTLLAAVHLLTGDEQQAAHYADQALVIHQETGHLLGEARAHVVLSNTADQRGDTAGSDFHRCQAESLLTAIGSPEAPEGPSKISA